MDIKSLTIYCSSSNLLELEYYKLASDIGHFLSKKKISIIYGGGKVGMMGKISKSALNTGGKVIGVIPEFLNTREIIDYDITQTIVVKNMSIRKQKLFDLGEAFLILPGGSGTIEEATEVISWKYLGIHNKDIIIFNYNNFWDHLIKMYDKTKIQKFGNKNLKNICNIVNNFEDFTKLF
tara:strand:- start:2305 stop:2841 length:537 start_codon:yes stop_codon:yes gene_type:complete